MIIPGKLFASFARILEFDPPFTLARFSGTSLEGVGRSRSSLFFVRLVSPDASASEPLCVPVSWLKRLARIAGARNKVELRREGPIVEARINGTTYRTSTEDDHAAPPFPAALEDGRTWALSSADFVRGGAVTVASHAAHASEARAGLHAVHLDGLVSGCDGFRLTQRRPAVDLGGLDALVPLSSVIAAIRLVGSVPPERLECLRTSERIRFCARVPGGVSWELDSPLVDPSLRPPYEKVTESSPGETIVPVDVADLREIWWPFRRDDLRVAIYRDGSLLAWGDLRNGIGTTLHALPAEAPVVILGGTVIKGLVDALPKSGCVAVAVGDRSARIAGEVVGLVREGVPAWVMTELAFTVPEAIQHAA
jgi:hypothetical protein